MPTYIIKVTKKDINQGVPKSPFDCPVSLALHRFSPGGHNLVTALDIRLYPSDATILLSIRAKRFIRRFDKGASVKPFSFKLRIPD